MGFEVQLWVVSVNCFGRCGISCNWVKVRWSDCGWIKKNFGDFLGELAASSWWGCVNLMDISKLRNFGSIGWFLSVNSFATCSTILTVQNRPFRLMQVLHRSKSFLNSDA